MKKILLYLLACVFSCAGFQSFAQKELPPKGEKPKDFKLPQKENITLPNGFHATLLPYGNVPKVSVMLVIKTGNVHENEQQVWLSDLTANMLNQGTSKLNFSALARKVATMGGNLAVSVSPDQIRVSGTVLSEFAADFIHLMADLVQNPAFPPGEMDRLKADLKRELILETSIPQNIAESLFARAIFKNTCY